MITKPTVLVLGAGASNPYSYLTGNELKKEIIDHLEQPGSEVYKTLLVHGFGEEKIIAFRKAFLLSGQSSVDAFLEHQPDFVELGKLAITAVLVRSENMEKLFKAEDWYAHLFHILDNSVLEDFGKNKLAIVTFNYDRSIETFLFNSLKFSYNLDDQTAAKVLSQIPIIHLHGQMGNLPWQDQANNRDYGEIENSQKIKESSEGIKIIYEAEVEKSGAFIEAKKLLANANQIYFLGFGYHPENMRRLGIEELDISGKTILGTCKGMTTLEAQSIMARCGGKINLLAAGSQSWTLLQFIRENISFV